ncbi:hypothetical protein [Pseudanabaena sp. BC1403]|uniref:hypothetical protein n=1 Tax=Pseudanabaena sp. BC1403 TaxID=2043171 RepID=UPI000CD985D3|nr:hypothetical protein [Pseudanabaena sp. BC1403]
MSLVNDAIRPFWINGLNEITGRQSGSLLKWIIDGNYQIYTNIKSDSFTLEIASTSKSSLLRAFAFDCNRMASASFESMQLIRKNESLPKSTAWLVIQSYYSAFFAAQSVLRMIGISCSQLDNAPIKKIQDIADIFSCKPTGVTIKSGYYKCRYDYNSHKLYCEQLNASGGSHESFWKAFYDELKDISNKILSTPSIPIADAQRVSVQIDVMCFNLCRHGKNGGKWLSYIRNKVNYQHEFNCWFPYQNIRKTSVSELYETSQTWLIDPMQINLTARDDILLFHRTCNFIVSLCRTLVEYMSDRCPEGRKKSYLADGSINLLNKLT